METVLVTGARGFLGRYASLAAAERGARVIGIGHGRWSPEDALSWGVSDWCQRDVTRESLAAIAASPALVVHCAGSGSAALAREEPARDFARTVGTTLEVLEFIRADSPRTALVYPSSGAVYGSAASIPVTIDAPLKPAGPYGVHKTVAEEIIRSYARSFDVNAAIVRVFSVYGAGLRKQLLWDASQKALRGESTFAGTGHETRDWVAAAEVADLLLIAGEQASTSVPVANGATGREVSMRELLSGLFAALGTDQQPRFSGAGTADGPERYAGDPSEALAWGWRPTRPWREGIAEYARWVLASGA